MALPNLSSICLNVVAKCYDDVRTLHGQKFTMPPSIYNDLLVRHKKSCIRGYIQFLFAENKEVICSNCESVFLFPYGYLISTTLRFGSIQFDNFFDLIHQYRCSICERQANYYYEKYGVCVCEPST